MKLFLKNDKVRLNSKAEVGRNVVFSVKNGGEIIVTGESYFIGNSKIYSNGGIICIGEYVTIGEYSFLNGAGGIVIENNVLMSDKVNLISEEHEYRDITKPVRQQGCNSNSIHIGEGSWVGVNVTVLSGTRIGKNCVVGANSLVKGCFPDYCVLAGNPARIIKKWNGTEWIKL